MWGVIQGPQGDLARAEWSCCPLLSSSSYLSARGLVPCHTAYCIYNFGSSSSLPPLLLPPLLTSSPSHPLVQQEAVHLFELTNLTIQPMCHYEWPRSFSLGYDSIIRIFVFIFLSTSLHSLLLFHASYKWCNHTSVHTIAEPKIICAAVFFSFLWGSVQLATWDDL